MCCRIRKITLGFIILGLLSGMLLYVPALAGGGPRNVVIVANQSSPISMAVADYYVQRRNLPADHKIIVNCPTSEQIIWENFDATIKQPLKSAIQTLEAQGRQIDYIVLTKGLPVLLYANNSSYSLESVLTCLSEDYTSTIVNPYGPIASGPGGWGSPAPVTTFSHRLSFSGRRFYLVSRLDAYTQEQIEAMIDSSIATQPGGTFLFDRRPGLVLIQRLVDDRMGAAATLLRNRGLNVIEDYTTQFIGNQTNLAGYFSWGSNDPAFTQGLYTSNQFRAGSIADSYVSTSCRTFYPTIGGQSLMADLFPQGLSGAGGYAEEPLLDNATYPNVLFDRYTLGFNAVESFYAAIPRLYWRNTVVGDPLMQPWATPPTVEFIEPTETTISGQTLLKVNATDVSGISKVEFYINNDFLGSVEVPPYEMTLDTANYANGLYTLEAIAYENTAIKTQGSSRIQVNISNSLYQTVHISQALGLQDGAKVHFNNVIVTQGNIAGGRYWVVDNDEPCGLEILGSYQAKQGDVLGLKGQMLTLDGRRLLITEEVVKSGTTSAPFPLAVLIPDLGGVSPHPAVLPSLSESGAYNVNRFVQVAGIIEQIDPWNGTATLVSADESASVRVMIEGFVPPHKANLPTAGKFVRVTGIVSTVLVESVGYLPLIVAPQWLAIEAMPSVTWSQSINRGMSYFSVPIEPYPCNAKQVFATGTTTQLPLEQNLWTWSPELQTWKGCGQYTNVTAGSVYSLKSYSNTQILYQGYDGVSGADAWINLGEGGELTFGLRGAKQTALSDCRLVDGLTQKTVSGAVAAGWIAPILRRYDPARREFLPFAFNEPVILYPSVVYKITPLKPNLALVTPQSRVPVPPKLQ